MSLENAILEHAAAIRELAAALRDRNVPLAALAGEAQKAVAEIKASTLAVDSSGADKELEQAVEKVEKGACASSASEAAANHAKAQLERAKEAETKNAASGAVESAGTSTGAQQDEEKLDFDKEIKPLLVKVAVKKGKEALADLLVAIGLQRGEKARADNLTAAQLADAKARAEKLIAAA